MQLAAAALPPLQADSKSPSPVLPASWAPTADPPPHSLHDYPPPHNPTAAAPPALSDLGAPPFPYARSTPQAYGGAMHGRDMHSRQETTPSPAPVYPPAAAVAPPPADAAANTFPSVHNDLGPLRHQHTPHSGSGAGERSIGPGQVHGVGSTAGGQSHSLGVWAGALGSASAQATPETARERAAREAAAWREDQEAAVEAELAAAGVQRQSILETEWRGRQAQRTAEHDACLATLADAESRIGKELAQLESHEARLAAAEGQAVKAAEGLERLAARRRGDTEGAVRRLQAELGHALDIERSRNADAEAARDAAAVAASAARSAAVASRRALRELHQARHQSESAQAERELDAARTEQEEAEARLQVSLEEKAGLRRAAQAVAGDLHAARSDAQAVADEGIALVCARVREAQVQLAASEHQQQLQAHEATLRSMLTQLQALKTSEES